MTHWLKIFELEETIVHMMMTLKMICMKISEKATYRYTTEEQH